MPLDMPPIIESYTPPTGEEVFPYDEMKHLLAEMMYTLNSPGYPLFEKKQIESIVKDTSKNIYIIQCHYPNDAQSSKHQETIAAVLHKAKYGSLSENNLAFERYFTLKMDQKNAPDILKKIGSKDKKPYAFVIQCGKIIQTITEETKETIWESLLLPKEVKPSSPQPSEIKFKPDLEPLITPQDSVIPPQNPVIPPQPPIQNDTLPKNDPEVIPQPGLKLDPLVRIQGKSETLSAYFAQEKTEYIMIVGVGGVRRDLALFGSSPRTKLKETGGSVSGTIQLGNISYKLTGKNEGGIIIFTAQLLKDESMVLANYTPAKPLSVVGKGVYLTSPKERFNVLTIDQRVYGINGGTYPDSRELTYDEKTNSLMLNGKDEGWFAFDLGVLYLNGKAANTLYTVNENKFNLPVLFKLVPCKNGVLRMELTPAPETIKAYEDQGIMKRPSRLPRIDIKKKTIEFSDMPQLPDLNTIGDIFDDITQIFEGDPSENAGAIEVSGDFSYTDFDGGKTEVFKGESVRGVYLTVYGVPHDMVGEVKAKWDPASKKVIIYIDGLFNKQVAKLSIAELMNQANDYPIKDRKGKTLHRGLITGGVDASGRLRVNRGNETYPGYESAESPLGWVLPVSLPPNFDKSTGKHCYVSSGWWGIRRAKGGGTRLHRSIDFSLPVGSTVNSVGDGIVKYAGVLGDYGNVVIIEHGNSYQTKYGHLKNNGITVRVGQKVKEGEKIGLSGHTGSSTHPHLHLEVRQGANFDKGIMGNYVHPESLIDLSAYDAKGKHTRGIKPPVKKYSQNTTEKSTNEMYRVGQVIEGKATYYHEGNTYTSSGERFDKNAMRAAHNGLPRGTKVRVTNTANGKSVDVIINDTGGFSDPTEIDVTEGVAKSLNNGNATSLDVKIEVLALGDGQHRQGETPRVQGGSNTGRTNTPTPETTTPPDLSNLAEYLKKPAQDRITVAITDGTKQFTHVKSLLRPNGTGARPGEHSVNSPGGRLVAVQNGKPVLVTGEGVKSLPVKGTVTVGGVQWSVALEDVSTSTQPKQGQFSLKKVK